MSETSYDIFFTGAEGYGEHIQIKAGSPLEAIELRAKTLELLTSVNAEPREQDRPRPKFQTPANGQVKRDPMQAAAAATGFIGASQVSAICPNDGSVMKTVPGGFSQRTQRPYPTFHVCNQCGHKANGADAN